MRKIVLLAVALACTLLAACETPYARKVPGLTSEGYSEIQIDESTYQVRFDGNGKTSRAKVADYWLYRCAELTREKGYELFAMAIPPKRGALLDTRPGVKPAAWRPHSSQPRLLPVYMVYIPGGRITTWHSRAVIRLFHEQLPPDVPYALRAQVVLDALHDYVESGGDHPPPTRESVIRLALVQNPSYGGPAAAPGGELLPDMPEIPPGAPPVPPAAPAALGDNMPPGQKSL